MPERCGRHFVASVRGLPIGPGPGVCALDAGHEGSCGFSKAPEKSTGVKAAQINAAPEVGAPTGAVMDLLALLGDTIASARRCGRAEIHGGDNLLRRDQELAENYRALTHALAEIVRRALLNVPCDPEADAYREDTTRELQKSAAIHTDSETNPEASVETSTAASGGDS